MRTAKGNAEGDAGEGKENDHLDDQEQDAREQERGEVLPARHGRSDEALEEFLLASFHDGKADAPDGGAHQVHAEQAGDDEVDVAGADFVNQVVARGDGFVAAGGGLNGAVGEQAGQAAVGVGVVVVVRRRPAGSEWRAARCCRWPARASPAASSMVVALRPLSAASACGELRRGGGHGQHVRRAIAEGDAEADRQQDGEDEDPEESFWLAQEEAEARGGELVERAELELTHRAGSFR